MALSEGGYELGPERGRLLIKTGRTGLGSRAGHDLTLEATRWSGRASESSAEVTVAVEGIEVREGTGGIKPLTDGDRAEIKRNLRKVLKADRHPDITFRSAAVEGTPEGFTVRGDLTIMGRTERVDVRGSVADQRARGGATVTQSRWGIKPYSAFFGALKLADDVEVSFDLGLD